MSTNVNHNQGDAVVIDGGAGTFLHTTTRIDREHLYTLIDEFVRESRANGYPTTPTIGVDFLIDHMDLDAFTDNLDAYIQDQFVQYIADAVSDAEIMLAAR